MRLSIIMCFGLLTFSSFNFAQEEYTDSLNFYQIILIDDSEWIGQISRQDSVNYVIVTSSGMEITVRKEEIKELISIEPGIISKDFFSTDPFADHLFFFPTARTVPSGKYMLTVYELFFPHLAVGVSNYVEVLGGACVLGVGIPFLYAGIKVSPLQISNLSLALGARHLFNTDGSLSAVYGVGTVEFENASLTSGIGYGYYEAELKDFPIIVVGGELQISNHIKFMTENWILPKVDYSFYSFGIRFFGSKLAGDFGLYYFRVWEDKSITVPWLGFSYGF